MALIFMNEGTQRRKLNFPRMLQYKSRDYVLHTSNVVLKMRKVLEPSRPLFCNVFLRFWRNLIEWYQFTDSGITQEVF